MVQLAGGRILARRCQARSKQSGLQQCGLPAMRGKQTCRLHGGKSTGPRTRTGRAAVSASLLKHGQRSRGYAQLTRKEHERLRALALLGKAIGLFQG